MTDKRNVTVMCYLKKDDKYLFLYRNKKENDMNEGKYLGVGGHVEEGESFKDAIIRETKEETNLDLLSVTLNGHVKFINDDYIEEMYVYTSSEFIGSIKDCDEGTLEWINKLDIYNLPMWEGDKYFLDLVINGETGFDLELYYSNDKFINCKRIK